MADGLICLIPARGGSKRFPRKNIAPLAGKPLLGWTIDAAKESGVFSTIVVSTDDADVANVARDHGAVVADRPEALAGDRSPVRDVVLNFVDTWPGAPIETICVALPTAALATADDYRGALAALDADADGVMTVTRYHEPPFWALKEDAGYLSPMWPDLMKRSQDLPAVSVDCGYFYFVRLDAFRREQTFYLQRLRAYHLPRLRTVDIDHPEDLEMAKLLKSLDVRGS